MKEHYTVTISVDKEGKALWDTAGYSTPEELAREVSMVFDAFMRKMHEAKMSSDGYSDIPISSILLELIPATLDDPSRFLYTLLVQGWNRFMDMISDEISKEPVNG